MQRHPKTNYHVVLLLALLFFSAAHALGSEDRTCLPCHRAIYEAYEKTSMARASGSAAEGFLPGAYHHELSGIDYRLQLKKGTPELAFSRQGPQEMHGSKPLAYYIGSGKRGRTFLFQTDGYWFQSPINWYSKRQVWEMVPGYATVHSMPSTLGVDEGCLFCHASGGQHSQPGSVNHFGERPFTQVGITCARCHGDASAHVASRGKAAIVNPAKLVPVRRDSICQQCHLEGETTVRRPGKTANDFRPGDLLTDNFAYFVHEDVGNANVRAVSQVEALAQSACKRRSGDALTCTTCHDPHRTIEASERTAWYRTRCLACHTGAKFAQHHYGENADCTSCHMPRTDTTDISHEQATDHRIVRGADTEENFDAVSSKLVPLVGSRVTARDYGLAYFVFAQKGDPSAMTDALRFLREASATSPRDAAVAFALGEIYEAQGDSVKALDQFTKGARIDPLYPGVMAMLGNLSPPTEAVPRWKQAYSINRADTALGLRLASSLCEKGETPAARQLLEEVLRFQPDFPSARSALQNLTNSNGHGCTHFER